jgi:hypothetical protein
MWKKHPPPSSKGSFGWVAKARITGKCWREYRKGRLWLYMEIY